VSSQMLDHISFAPAKTGDNIHIFQRKSRKELEIGIRRAVEHGLRIVHSSQLERVEEKEPRHGHSLMTVQVEDTQTESDAT
jgi:hypothetical protein